MVLEAADADAALLGLDELEGVAAVLRDGEEVADAVPAGADAVTVRVAVGVVPVPVEQPASRARLAAAAVIAIAARSDVRVLGAVLITSWCDRASRPPTVRGVLPAEAERRQRAARAGRAPPP
ncbi:hypothetical protein [Amnibacterium endophyticum]|uniref:Uncharacterized protein n=1 Tax=Amnibacterium endophyticum TaxID=2109337 RepID=A0ABW4LHU5_9MICO